MFLWEFVVTFLSIVIGIVLMAIVPEALRNRKNQENDNKENPGDEKDAKKKEKPIQGAEHPKIKRRLDHFAEFFKILTHEKTANHIGGSEMKSLRGMMCQKTLNELSPAVLRGWSRAVRDRVGTFHKIRTETCQFVENLQQASSPSRGEEEFCQLTAQLEFSSLEKKDKYAFRSSPQFSSCSSLSSAGNSPSSSLPSKNVSSSSSTSASSEKQQQQELSEKGGVISVCPCLIRFRTAASEKNGKSEEGDLPSLKEQIVGFHILPPSSNESSKANPPTPLPFDIISFIDPFELDQFAEGAIETLFDNKYSKDPMQGFFRYCVKPLQKLYDVTVDDEEAKKKSENKSSAEETTTNSNNVLPPKQRREKLAFDLMKVKSSLGLTFDSSSSSSSSSFSSTTTLNTAEIDEKIYGPNLKAICARVTHTGPERDCIVTLHILLDADSPFGIGIVKYSFGLTAPKKKTMLFDQDSQNPLGTF